MSRSDEDRKKLFFEAVAHQDFDTVTDLLNQGLGINCQNDFRYSTFPPIAALGDTALIIASRQGCLRMVDQLLERGADLEVKGEHEATALIIASVFQREEVVRLLLDRGADVEARDIFGATSLIWSARTSVRNVVISLLLDKGADIEAKDETGKTPLMKASERSDPAAAAFLLDRGADIGAKDDSGKTALMVAQQDYARKEIVDLLLDRGAKVEEVPEEGHAAAAASSAGVDTHPQDDSAALLGYEVAACE